MSRNRGCLVRNLVKLFFYRRREVARKLIRQLKHIAFDIIHRQDHQICDQLVMKDVVLGKRHCGTIDEAIRLLVWESTASLNTCSLHLLPQFTDPDEVVSLSLSCLHQLSRVDYPRGNRDLRTRDERLQQDRGG